MEFFCEVILARQFETPEGIVCRVPGVWVLSFTTYFNCCPFLLNMINCKSPSGDQLIFMSRNGNSSFVTIWTLSSFAGVWDFYSVVHISAVNCHCFLKLFWTIFNFSCTFLSCKHHQACSKKYLILVIKPLNTNELFKTCVRWKMVAMLKLWSSIVI